MKNRENRTRRVHIFIDKNTRNNDTTPTGSHLPDAYIFYKYAIPSGLSFSIIENRTRRVHIFINKNTRNNDTTPTGSHFFDIPFFYKHLIPLGLSYKILNLC